MFNFKEKTLFKDPYRIYFEIFKRVNVYLYIRNLENPRLKFIFVFVLAGRGY